MKNKYKALNLSALTVGIILPCGTFNVILAFLIGSCLLFLPSYVQAQEIDILLKGGHLIDPKNNIDSKMDVAIAEGRIFHVAADIPPGNAKLVIDVSGLYISPGLIDLHTHVFYGSQVGKFADGTSSVNPDNFAPRSGVTTVVDAGTAGWRNFPAFKKQVVELSKTRVLSFLNAFGAGMIGSPEEEDINDLNTDSTLKMIHENADVIVGIKIGHYRGTDWGPFDKAVAFARQSDRPLFVECHLRNLSFEGQLSRMRSGDIVTHAFEEVTERTPLVDRNGDILPYVLDARRRGILFDVGHGGGGFRFSQAIPAMMAGFPPDSFGTDMHHNSVNAGMKDMLNIMSKYLNMGMDISNIISRATWKPAKAIKRSDLGHLSKGAVADIAVLGLKDGDFGFVDARGFRIHGAQKFETELTIRNGEVIWDLNGISAKKYVRNTP